MSAVLKTPEAPPQVHFVPMHAHGLGEVMRIEQAAYAFPWSIGNVQDSIRAGYECQVLVAGRTVLGYFIAMQGVREVHLLNITVAAAHQGQGWARMMLDALCIWSRGKGAAQLWLEVRASNARALHIYQRYGFKTISVRKRYYPAGNSQREDAVVMSLPL
jgi:[ribosomal protein S18]-alanine N-acetyltransferase